MNVRLPKKEKVSKKRISIYLTAIAICIFSLSIVIGIQVLGNDIIDNMFGINKLVKRTEQEEASLKANFENIFDNKLKNSDNYTISKKDENLEIVYTSYQKEEKTDKHEININLPYVNIENKDVQALNQEIINTFQAKSEEVLKNETDDIIYTVKYKANIENKILSLIIYSDLKQGTNAQRVIIQTFNYDLEANKKLSLQEIINRYDLSKMEVQNKINRNIQDEQKKADELRELGYNVFSRDIKSDVYKLENATEFFIFDNNVYIVFAYGNTNMTSELDIVII